LAEAYVEVIRQHTLGLYYIQDNIDDLPYAPSSEHWARRAREDYNVEAQLHDIEHVTEMLKKTARDLENHNMNLEARLGVGLQD
jgi:hypothetical protein